MPVTIHSDHPTLNDKLNRIASIKNKAEQIMYCDTPQVFGIHGDWGSGKTSYLRQLRYHLDGCPDGVNPDDVNVDLPKDAYRDQVVTVWFDAWRYQHEAAPVIALLQEIRKQFGTWAKFKGKTAKLAEVTLNSLLNGFSDITKLLALETSALNPKKIQEVGEQWEKEHLEQRLGVDSVHDFLEKATGAVLSSFLGNEYENKRLVIFIDDLDRCSSAAAYRLLEGLKVYLSLKKCVFVIGMNQQIVIEAVAAQLPQDLASYSASDRKAAMCVRGEAYLEKLCSHIERLKQPHSSDDFLFGLVDNSHFKLALIESAVLMTNQFLPPNPRRLKALANLLNEWGGRVDWDNKPEREKIILAQGLLIAAYVYQFHGELFQRWSFTPAFFSQLSQWVKGELSAPPGYLNTLDLPHELANNDNPNDAVRVVNMRSTFPDPYATNMFWIAPYMLEADLTEQDISPVLQLIK